MNSAQRRKLKRAHPHFVTLRADEGNPWFIFDNKAVDAKRWCDKKIKNKNYNVEHLWDSSTFKFASEGDAVMFALKWA
jgi:hypothetical protein